MRGESEPSPRGDREAEGEGDHGFVAWNPPDGAEAEAASSEHIPDQSQTHSKVYLGAVESVPQPPDSVPNEAQPDTLRSSQDDLEIDLRFTEPSVAIRDGSVAVPADPPQATPPIVDAGLLLERHVAGSRVAQIVTRHDTAARRRVGRMYHLAKRWVDVGVSLILLVILLPVLVFVAAAVALTSPGPILYRHLRHGVGGAEFTMFKFRSMVAGADSMLDEMEDLATRGEILALDEVVFKARDDPRITATGRFLRRTNLDEIPQLLNVIAGHMSLVGPRPLVTAEVDTLSAPVIERRQSVAPGITCLWQVARREDTTFAERMALDLLYVDRRSALLDSYLFVLTPMSVFRGVRSH